MSDPTERFDESERIIAYKVFTDGDDMWRWRARMPQGEDSAFLLLAKRPFDNEQDAEDDAHRAISQWCIGKIQDNPKGIDGRNANYKPIDLELVRKVHGERAAKAMAAARSEA